MAKRRRTKFNSLSEEIAYELIDFYKHRMPWVFSAQKAGERFAKAKDWASLKTLLHTLRDEGYATIANEVQKGAARVASTGRDPGKRTFRIKFAPGAVDGVLADALHSALGMRTSQYRYDRSGSTVEFKSVSQLKAVVRYLREIREYAKRDGDFDDMLPEIDRALREITSAVRGRQWSRDPKRRPSKARTMEAFYKRLARLKKEDPERFREVMAILGRKAKGKRGRKLALRSKGGRS